MYRLFLVCSLLVFCACSVQEDVKIFAPYEGPLAEIHNVESLFSDSAIVRVKMKSPLQYELQNNDREFPKGVFLEFYDIKGNVETTLESNYALYDSEQKIYHIKGNVIIKNIIKKEQLNSEELIWNPVTEIISAPEDVQVRIQTQEEMLIGKGLTAKQDFSEYKILQPTGIFSIEN